MNLQICKNAQIPVIRSTFVYWIKNNCNFVSFQVFLSVLQYFALVAGLLLLLFCNHIVLRHKCVDDFWRNEKGGKRKKYGLAKMPKKASRRLGFLKKQEK